MKSIRFKHLSGFAFLLGFFFFISCEKKVSIVKVDDGLSAEEHIKLGMIYYQDGEIEAARKQFERAVLEDKANADAWFGLGLCQHRLENYEQAGRAFQKAVELRPDYATAHNNLADCYLKLGRLDRAEKEAQEAIRTGNQNLGYFHLTYVEVLIARGKIESACAELKTAKSFSENDGILASRINELWEKNCDGR